METELMVQECEDLLGYHFKNRSLLMQALTHSTFAYESFDVSVQDNQRLEFLGDSVLNLVAAEHFYREHPRSFQGELTRYRSSVVNNKVLAEKAENFKLSRFLLLGKGEEKTQGRHNPTNLAAALEAIIGAIFLDGGMKKVKKFIKDTFKDDIR